MGVTLRQNENLCLKGEMPEKWIGISLIYDPTDGGVVLISSHDDNEQNQLLLMCGLDMLTGAKMPETTCDGKPKNSPPLQSGVSIVDCSNCHGSGEDFHGHGSFIDCSTCKGSGKVYWQDVHACFDSSCRYYANNHGCTEAWCKNPKPVKAKSN